MSACTRPLMLGHRIGPNSLHRPREEQWLRSGELEPQVRKKVHMK